jgi:hypothetical protein
MGAEEKHARTHTREGLEKLQRMQVSIMFQGFTKGAKLKNGNELSYEEL